MGIAGGVLTGRSSSGSRESFFSIVLTGFGVALSRLVYWPTSILENSHVSRPQSGAFSDDGGD